MIHFDGKDYQKIALHGGGNPMFGHYVGFFETLRWFEDFESFSVPLITSSAGSMAILYFVLKMKNKNKDISYLFSKILEECENVLSNLDQRSVVSFEYMENLISTDFECLYNMKFKDLNQINPNFEWTICCSKYTDYDFSLKTYGTHTPDVLIWKACLASMALPIIFPPIEIDGCLNCDGDFSNWIEGLDLIDDESILHIAPQNNSTNYGFKISTDFMLIDELLQFSICCLKTMTKIKEPIHGVYRLEFVASVHKHFFSEEYIESGKLMAEKIVLK